MSKARDEYAFSCNNMIGQEYNEIIKNYIIWGGNYTEYLEQQNKGFNSQYNIDAIKISELEQQKAELIAELNKILSMTTVGGWVHTMLHPVIKKYSGE